MPCVRRCLLLAVAPEPAGRAARSAERAAQRVVHQAVAPLFDAAQVVSNAHKQLCTQLCTRSKQKKAKYLCYISALRYSSCSNSRWRREALPVNSQHSATAKNAVFKCARGRAKPSRSAGRQLLAERFETRTPETRTGREARPRWARASSSSSTKLKGLYIPRQER